MFLVLSLLAFGLVLLLDWQTVALSFVAVALAASYPFMKRYTHWPQAVLGAAFGWAVPMAFSAVTGTLPALAWLLFLATLTWALIYDTEYAMVDREDDLKIGVKSTAILFGDYDRLIIGLLQLAMLGMLLAVGFLAGRGIFYFGALAGAVAMALRQQYLMRERDPRGCFKAFLNNNGFGYADLRGVGGGLSIGLSWQHASLVLPGQPGDNRSAARTTRRKSKRSATGMIPSSIFYRCSNR